MRVRVHSPERCRSAAAATLAIVCFGFAVAILGSLFGSGYSIALQIDQLLQALNQGPGFLEQKMADFGFSPAGASGGSASIGDLFRFLFPNPNQLLGQAQSAFSRTLGSIGDAAIFLLIGVFVAADPATYRERVLEFLPLRKRQSVALLLDEVSKSLRRWLIGQLAAMLLLAVLTWIALLALRVPGSLLLGVQTGLLEFIPYLGSVIAAVPIFLIALPLGTFTTVVALELYAILHMLVGMIVIPLIQKQTLDLPPALAVASLNSLWGSFRRGGSRGGDAHRSRTHKFGLKGPSRARRRYGCRCSFERAPITSGDLRGERLRDGNASSI